MNCPTCGATCRFTGNRDFNNTEYWRCDPCQRTWIVVDHLPNDPTPHSASGQADESGASAPPRCTSARHESRPLFQAQIGALKKGFNCG